MKIDAHQHFWLYNEKEYGWISGDMNALKRDFMPADLERHLKALQIDGTVLVQARQTIEETFWLLEIAESNEMIKGVVGWVDLCSSNVKEQLEQVTKSSYLKGIRHIIHDELDDRFMLREDFQKGIRALQDFNLTYDLLLFPKHLPYALELVEKYPNQRFVLNHLGKPDIKNQVLSPWKENMIKLAACENVYVKLSGMVTEASWKHWREEDFHSYLDIVFQAFGPERLMIGSDWPVCTVSDHYERVMEIVMKYIKQHIPEAEDLIVGENCVRFYRLS